MQHKSPIQDDAASPLLAVAAVAFAVAIFIVDTFTPLGIAVAVLYVVVVLMAGSFFQRRGVLFVGATCVVLTALSYVLQHGETYGPALVRCLVSIAAIGITTFLALKIQLADTVLREQAGLLDVTHDAVFVRDMNDVITYWNRGAEQLYGWEKEQAVGQVSHRLLQTAFPAPLEEIKEAVLATGRWGGELLNTKRDGTQVTVAGRWSTQRDERGEPVATLETNNDITERKRAEAKAQQQDKELQLTIDTIPAIVFSNLPDGSTDFLNERWLDYTGLSLTDAQGFGWQAAYHPEDLVRVLKMRSESMAAGKPYEGETRIRGAGGDYRWFMNRAAPLRDEHGTIVKWYGTNTDIEDRKRAGDALSRSETYLAEAQRLSRTGSFGWNIKRGEILWSEETFRIFSYDPATPPTLEMVLQRTHPEDRGPVKQLLDRVSQDGQDWELEHRLLMPDGAVKYVHVVAHAMRNASNELEFVGAVMDVSAAKQAEAELHRTHTELAHVTRVTTLGELAASIAHEVNQPLAAVVTNADSCLRWLDRDTPQLGEARDAVARIIRDAHRAGEVIRRIRDLAMKTDLQPTPLDLNEAIHDSLLLVQRELVRQRVALRLELAPKLPPVLGDRVQLQQVIINLVMNGIEAMAPVNDRPRELKVRSQEEGGDQVLVAVQDSGIGVDPAHVDRLFDAFFTTKPDGMGMGLSICRSIVEAHEGRLSASPNSGPGATFQFTLPAHREDAS